MRASVTLALGGALLAGTIDLKVKPRAHPRTRVRLRVLFESMPDIEENQQEQAQLDEQPHVETKVAKHREINVHDGGELKESAS